MLVICIRALILYFVVLLVTRLMGKRELGQMQPFELVISMLLANLASGPMSNVGVPLYTGVLAILSLLIVHVFLAIIIQKSDWIRNTVCGQPLILIDKGQVNVDAMRRTRYNFSDLMEQLRSSGVFDAAQVEYAILETDGSLSVLEKAAPTNSVPPLPYLVVLDGKIQHTSLDRAGRDETWLSGKLKKMGYPHLKNIAYAAVNENGDLSIMPVMQGHSWRIRP